MSDQSQKTEKPSQKRLQKARTEGQFPTSREFVGGLQFLAVVMVLGAWGAGWFQNLQVVLAQMIRQAFRPDFTINDFSSLIITVAGHVFLPLLIAGGLLVVLTLGFQFAVTRFGFSMHRLAPDWNRMNPFKRLQELPKQNLGSAFQAAAILALCSLAFYHIAIKNAELFFLLPLTPLDSGIRQVFASIADLLWKSAAVFVAFGCFSLARALFRFQAQMRMSKQELREEYKEVEGHPAIKARIRRLQRNMLRRKMMQRVPQATAIVCNPTHYAVAIQYELDSANAPVVTAKGKNYLAFRIRSWPSGTMSR